MPITKIQYAEIHIQLHKCILHFSVHNIEFLVPRATRDWKYLVTLIKDVS